MWYVRRHFHPTIFYRLVFSSALDVRYGENAHHRAGYPPKKPRKEKKATKLTLQAIIYYKPMNIALMALEIWHIIKITSKDKTATMTHS